MSQAKRFKPSRQFYRHFARLHTRFTILHTLNVENDSMLRTLPSRVNNIIATIPSEDGTKEFELVRTGLLSLAQNLVGLSILNCPNFVLPLNIGYHNTGHLEYLCLSNATATTIQGSICDLSGLQCLHLNYPLLQHLPARLGDLKNLTSLYVDGCYSLVKLPHSFINLDLLNAVYLPPQLSIYWDVERGQHYRPTIFQSRRE